MHAALQDKVTKRWLAAHDPPLFTAVLKHFGRVSAARAAANVPEPTRRQWTTERIVKELRALHAQRHRITSKNLENLGRDGLLTAIRKYARGLVHARRLAGIPEPTSVWARGAPWDAARVIDEIVERAADGASLAYRFAPSSLIHAGERIFGSWQAAIEAAGLDYNKIRLIRQPYSETEVIAVLRKLARRHPTMGWIDLNEHPASKAMIRHFGSVQGAVRAARIVGWPKSKTRTWNRQRVIDALRLHRDTPWRQVSAVYTAAIKQFGSVRAAKIAAKLPVMRERKRWSKERVIAELRACHGVVDGSDTRLYQASVMFFGSIATARTAAGVPPIVRGVWTKERVIAALREATARGTGTLSTALYGACMHHFGGTAAARSAAGVPPAKKVWTKERVITALREAAARGDSTIDKNLRYGCVRVFGGVAAARRAARIVMASRRGSPNGSGNRRVPP